MKILALERSPFLLTESLRILRKSFAEDFFLIPLLVLREKEDCLNHLNNSKSSLLVHCRWLIRLRWLVAVAVVAGSVCEKLHLSWYSSETATVGLGVGIGILGYNLLLWSSMRSMPLRRMPAMAWVWAQIFPDLVALTILALWTGATHSPLLGFYVFHMVFASLLLSREMAYAVAAVAGVMWIGSLQMTGRMPEALHEKLMVGGWGCMLLITVYLANHITQNLRIHQKKIKTQQVRLRTQYRQIHAILDAAADAIVTLDEQGCIQLVNHAAEQMFGYAAEEMENQQLSLLIPDDAESEHGKEAGSALWEGAGRSLELIAQRKDGSTFPVAMTFGTWHVNQQRFLTGIIHDVTEYKQAEQELRQLNEKLRSQQMNMIQHEKMVAVGQMVAGITHEIANPLAGIDSVLQLIERKPDRMSPQRLVSLREQVNRIETIIRDMSNFAHPTDRQWQIVPMGELVATALSAVRFDRRHRNVTIEQRLKQPTCYVRVQPHAIQQVFVNLLLNAFDAVAEVQNPAVYIDSECCEGCCSISFCDNGKGVADADCEKIFEPFFTTKPLGKGTGLGLAICQELLRQQNGKIKVTSNKPNAGATFTVTLPKGEQPQSRGF